MNLKQYGTSAGRGVAVLKLDLSPMLPSEPAHGNSGKARVYLALRGKINCGGEESSGFRLAGRET